MTRQNSLSYLDFLVQHGILGSREDVDYLMQVLARDSDIATIKQVDYALGFVKTQPGRERLRHYLFEGQQIQRNYSALYFKRAGHTELLHSALVAGKIDWEQGFAS